MDPARHPRAAGHPRAARRAAVPAALAALSALLGCSPAPEGRTFLLLTIDTLRTNRLGSYGCPGGTTPVLDRFATSALLFTDCQSVSSWTMPAMGTLATGVRPCEHEMLYWHMPLGPVQQTVAEALAERGVTSAFFGNPIPALEGLDRGFERWETFEGDDEAAVAEAVRYLERTRGDRFVWVHLLSPHAPYDPLPELVRGCDAEDPRTVAYEGEVRTVDHWTQHLLEVLPDSAAVCITADHGEALAGREEIEYDHGKFLFEELIRIPCLLRVPGGRTGISKEPLRLADIPATVCDWFGAAPPPDSYGMSLLPVAHGGTLGRNVPRFAMVVEDEPPADKDVRWSVRDGNRKAIFNLTTGAARLYDLATDPGETEDLARERPRELAALKAELDEWRAAAPMPRIPFEQRFSPIEQHRLQSLGYLGGAN